MSLRSQRTQDEDIVPEKVEEDEDEEEEDILEDSKGDIATPLPTETKYFNIEEAVMRRNEVRSLSISITYIYILPTHAHNRDETP